MHATRPPPVPDLYGPVLANALFPAFEALRGRPTVPLLRYLLGTERWSLHELRDLQLGFARRLVRHAYLHTPHYRAVMDQRGIDPRLGSLDDLAAFPLLDRPTVIATMDARIADAPPFVAITKGTSGTSGTPVKVKYNVESRHWRDATRWRGYGWGGYRIGMRAMHFWGFPPAIYTRAERAKIAIDRAFKRDLYVDCTFRSDEALLAAVKKIESFRPDVIVAYAAGGAALARFIVDRKLRTWKRPIPIVLGAERVWPRDREFMEQAFGPVFESYGCREVMLLASECEAHAGMHESMENLYIELIVRTPDGGVRAAKPGETGEVVVTDLHNLACPMIRYVNGDVAVAREPDPCPCGRGLARLGPIEGRVTETLRDGNGNAVGGLVFNILIGTMEHVVRQFQVVQRVDRSILMRIIPLVGSTIPEQAIAGIKEFGAKYLPGAPLTIEYVDAIPLTRAGKRTVVIVETE